MFLLDLLTLCGPFCSQAYSYKSVPEHLLHNFLSHSSISVAFFPNRCSSLDIDLSVSRFLLRILNF